jgi:hypothetical protein
MTYAILLYNLHRLCIFRPVIVQLSHSDVDVEAEAAYSGVVAALRKECERRFY